jgi:hypothetical protein
VNDTAAGTVAFRVQGPEFFKIKQRISKIEFDLYLQM